jgi:hypothetical protein
MKYELDKIIKDFKDSCELDILFEFGIRGKKDLNLDSFKEICYCIKSLHPYYSIQFDGTMGYCKVAELDKDLENLPFFSTHREYELGFYFKKSGFGFYLTEINNNTFYFRGDRGVNIFLDFLRNYFSFETSYKMWV